MTSKTEDQPVPAEWKAWLAGEGRCPYCEGLPDEDFSVVCDCWQYEREKANRAE